MRANESVGEKTNWSVITGAPSSGKTTVINALASLGYPVAEEVARDYIKQLLNTCQQRKAAYRTTDAVQQQILHLKSQRENLLDVNAPIFFDRGIPDSIAYCRFYQLDETKALMQSSLKRYHFVFFLEGLPIVNDGIRHESQSMADKLGELILNAYLDLGYDVIQVPVMSVEARVHHILSVTELRIK